MNTTGISEITRVEYYNAWAPGRVNDPYDCTKTKPSGGGNDTKYCLQSRFYACAVKSHCPIKEPSTVNKEKQWFTCAPKDQTKLANFFPCAEGVVRGGLSRFSDVLPCAKKFDLNIEEITKCADPEQTPFKEGPGVVIDGIQAIADHAKPANKYFPDVRVNGKKLEDTHAKSLIKQICKEYNGPHAPAACA